MKKLGVIGAGRLGVCFALLCESTGVNVLASDIREDYVEALNNKNIVTNEPEVENLLSRSTRFKATVDNIRVIQECDVIYTLVATPSLEDGSYDVSAVWKVVEDFKSAGDVSGKTFVIGCTTNPGDCQKIQEELSELGVDVFYNPEFIAQGSIVKDLRYADMILLGGPETEHRNAICRMYYHFMKVPPVFSYMSVSAAEVVKLATNCFLTTKISYANMVGETLTLAGLGDEVDSVLDAIGSDSRVGKKYLKYGYGFGGPCLPRDNRAFAAYAQALGVDHGLGFTTDQINDNHAAFLCKRMIDENKEELPFFIEDIAYKPGTDILTESQQLRLATDLLEGGKKVYIGRSNIKAAAQIIDSYREKYEGLVSFEEPKEEVFRIEL